MYGYYAGSLLKSIITFIYVLWFVKGLATSGESSAPSKICVSHANVISINGKYKLHGTSDNSSHPVYKHTTEDIYISFYTTANIDGSGPNPTWAFRSKSYQTQSYSYSYCQSLDTVNSNPKTGCTKWSKKLRIEKCNTVQLNGGWSASEIVWCIFCVIAFVAYLLFVLPPCPLYRQYCMKEMYDATSLSCYSDVLKQRGFDPDEIQYGDNRPFVQLVIRSDLYQDKCIWHNDYKKDWLFRLRNNHELFSPWFADDSHPFHKRHQKRLFFASLAINFTLAVVLQYWLGIQSHSSSEGFRYGISFAFSAVVTLTQTTLSYCVRCPCVEYCCSCCRNCCHNIAWCVSSLTLLFGMGSLAGAGVIMWLVISTYGRGIYWSFFTLNFVFGLFQSWFILQFLLMWTRFHCAWLLAHPSSPPSQQDSNDQKSKQWKVSKVQEVHVLRVLCLAFYLAISFSGATALRFAKT
ncbi:hypothetical protein RFI_30376 [Reticulomyxa filosa]|uniref:Uncharacterized protein n=1 Tax=Reticulomyxa filosa TaxID=46433 RepID=X6LZH8_RETFI|nr:hypothetical protein RFI_30376 [Reticulomyxa filosa]|eukprot:ETO07014.1 hypothetical protein RFI_30376 [Reticulomyxa filosa]